MFFDSKLSLLRGLCRYFLRDLVWRSALDGHAVELRLVQCHYVKINAASNDKCSMNNDLWRLWGQMIVALRHNIFDIQPRICRRHTLNTGGRDSSVGIATCYGLDGPGIESRWRQAFPYPSRTVLGPTQPPVQWVPALSRGVKRPGRGVDHPTHLAPRLKKE